MADEAFVISPANQALFKETVLKYLNGTYTIDETRDRMRLACLYDTRSISAKTLAKSIKLFEGSDTHLDHKIVEILQHLKMKLQKGVYVDQGILSLYDLLRKQNDLRKDKDQDLDYLVEMIDDLYPPVPLLNYIYRPALLTIGVLSFSYLQPQYFWMAIDWVTDILPLAYYWLHHYVVQLNNWPVIGMGMQIAWLVYYLRYTYQHGLYPSKERIRTLGFRAIALTLNFLGHLLSYSAAGALSWGPALFFIASSLISIVESIHFYATQEDRKSPPENADVHAKALHIRYNYTKERNFYYFLVRLIHAISITALLLICTVLPPSLILTMTYTLTLSLSFLIKDYCIELIKHRSAISEQEAVAKQYHSYENRLDKKKEAEKNQFQRYASEIIESYQQVPVKQAAFRDTMLELLSSEDFVYDKARESFDRCVVVGDKVSPSPQSRSNPPLSQSKYGLHQSDLTGTPTRGVRLTGMYTPGDDRNVYQQDSQSLTK